MTRHGVPCGRRASWSVGVLVVLVVGLANPPMAWSGQPNTGNDPSRAFLDRHCTACHNSRSPTAQLSLDAEAVDPGRAPAHAEVWEKVLRKLRTGAMPPVGRPRPAADEVAALVRGLETSIDRAAASRPAVGRPLAHRLNRTEYANAVRDLLALDIDGAALLPPDDAGFGFDNIGDVLTVSPLLLERYMSAAGKVARLAVGSAKGPRSHTYQVSKYLRQDDRMGEDLPFGTRGGTAVRHTFPASGEYLLKLRLLKNHRDQIRGVDQRHDLEVRVDGARKDLFTVGWTPDLDIDRSTYLLHGDAELNTRVRVGAGPHLVSAAFLARPTMPEGPLGPIVSVASFGFSADLAVSAEEAPALWTLEIEGPLGAAEELAAEESPSHERLFVCRPTRTLEERSCATEILGQLSRRAYRRPVTDADLAPLLEYFEDGRRRGGFEGGIELALRKVLVSPEFLFRIERDPVDVGPAVPYRLSDLELASRLSFFLWSTIPDDELLAAAETGRLGDSAELRRQVERMLADPRSRALVDNFAGQWLFLRNMRLVMPDPQAFPEFDDNLREAFSAETELFLLSQLREDKSVLDMLTADYTFLNERLARHYGIPGVYGSHHRLVSLTDPNRHGLLGHGSVLTVTSYANRTSPVLRGKWLLENLLGAPPPPPPADVPALKEIGEEGVAPSSVRERLELHRQNPACATCHAQMDPLGFALENFDAIGRWRTTGEGGAPIDASATTPDGTTISGPGDLAQLLTSQPELFAATVVEKLMTYALGRGVEHYDSPVVRAVVREAADEGYRWSALISGIVSSSPFQMRMSATESAE